MEEHDEKVQRIAASVKQFHRENRKFRIFRGATNSTRNQALRNKKDVVDTSKLNQVLKVDTQKNVVLVEANVSGDRLIEATLKHNLIPQVVADFPGITVGGGYSGTTGESSSFKHGFFDRTVNRVEMVLATGEVVNLSDTEHPDLFRGAAGGLGTFGVVTLLEIRLERATRFVQATYHPVGSIEGAVESCQYFTNGAEYAKNDYVDGIMWSKVSGAIITGRRTDEANPKLSISRFSGAWDPWFAWHVKERLEQSDGTAVTELIPLPDYLFRYDRGGFWMAKSIFDFTGPWLPFNRTTRYLLDDYCHTRMLYAATRAQPINTQIIHDCAVPYEAAADFIDWAADATGIWPMWLCPLKQSPQPTLHPHAKNSKLTIAAPTTLLNVGIWGPPRDSTLNGYFAENKEIEQKLNEVNGMKWMYSPYLGEESEFWKQVSCRS